VRIEAEPLPGEVVEVPRAALREGDEVWVATDDDRLAIRQVQVAWRREETLLLSRGVAPGERVVTSPLAVPVDGMRLRVEAEERESGSSGPELEAAVR
jgi:hypothetical protein